MTRIGMAFRVCMYGCLALYYQPTYVRPSIRQHTGPRGPRDSWTRHSFTYVHTYVHTSRHEIHMYTRNDIPPTPTSPTPHKLSAAGVCARKVSLPFPHLTL